MTKQEVIKSIEEEMAFCTKQNIEALNNKEDNSAILWNGKYAGLKLALEYVMELDED